MKLKYYLLPLLALAACEKEPQVETPEAKELTIVASADGAIIPEWKAADEIKVVYAEEMYTFAADKAGKTASFKISEGNLTADMIKEGPVSAYYNCTNMFGTFRIQAEQSYKDGKSSATIPAYAYTMNTPENNMLAMAFKPLASVLKLEVAPYDVAIEKIIIKPAEGAVIAEGALAGGFTANAAQGSVKVSNEINEIVVTLAAPMDVKQGAVFNIPMGWFSIEGGLDITMIYDGVKEYPATFWADGGVVKSYNDEGGLKSAKVIEETFEFDENSFPRAWYVKANGSADAKGTSWETATSLTNALATALSGSVLHVAAGNYVSDAIIPVTDSLKATLSSTDVLKSFFVDKNITIIGGYPANATAGAVADAAANATVLDGNGVSLHTMVVGAPKVDGEKVVIEGVTIKGGKNVAEDQTVLIPVNGIKLAGNYAAGIALFNSTVEMKNVTITANMGNCAAGLYCAGSDVTMTGCKVDANEGTGNGAGAWFTTGTKLLMDGCSVNANKTAGVCAGLYLYVPASKVLEADIRNSHFDNNIATGNAGGAYVRDDSGENLMKSSFTNCTFNGNSGTMGASVLVLNAKTSFAKTSFSNNRNSGNGVIYVNTSGTSSAETMFDGCTFSGNACADGAAAGCMGGLYTYNNSTGTLKTYVINSLFADNKSNGRGSAIYARNNQVNDVYLLCANTTFTNNTCGSVGSAINLYGAAAKKTVADVISCTMVGNISAHETNFAALCCETAGTTMNVYNTICAGNHTANGVVCDTYNKAGVMTLKYSLVGADYYGADAAVAAVTPAFDFATMVGALADNGGDTKTMKLVGNASSNPAFANGMAVADLKAFASDRVAADVFAKDQIGTARTDSDKIVGACAKK